MDYYFDSTEGSDRNTGSSPDQAWADFDRIHEAALCPGDRVLLRRGSHFTQQLRVSAVGRSDGWIEITAYGQGPRPVVEGRRAGACEEIAQSGSLDETAPCIHVTEAAYLRVSHLTVYNACYGLLINNYAASHSHIVVEDVIALEIHNAGQEDPRVNSAGIEVAVGRGKKCADITVRDVTIRRCECYRTGTGFSTRAYGRGCSLENVTVEKVTSHDHANTPWSYVGLFLRGVRNSTYDGACLDRCAPHWKHTGTATVHYIRSDHVVFRNGYIANTQDTDSHDMGAWDFEGGGDDCVIERCTFAHNAGPAIEYLRCEDTAQNVTVRDCTFIHNDASLWGGAAVLHVGRTGPPPTGSVYDNHYVLAPGTRLGGEEFFTMRDNREYADVADLPPYVAPPAVDAGGDRAMTELSTTLSGRVANATASRWEAVVAPGEVAFDDPHSPATGVRFSCRGTYVLRLAAENEHFLYGDYVTIRCVEDLHEEMIARWRFDRDGRDASGGGHDAALHGAAAVRAGSRDEPAALTLSGEGDFAQTGPVALGEAFTLLCRVRLDGSASGPQVVVAGAGGGEVIDGFRLCADRSDGSIVLATGNGVDQDAAYSDRGALCGDGWHDLAVAVDCTSRDGRGEARIFLDGRDVTLFGGVQSDMNTHGALTVGAAPQRWADGPDRPDARQEDADAAIAGLPVPAGFRLAMEDSFDGPLDENWRVVSGDWHGGGGRLAVEGKGELLCTRKFPGDVLVIYEAGTTVARPCDLSATLNAMPEVPTMHGYFFGFGTDDNACSRLVRRTGPIGRYDARITPGTVHRVACMRAGRTLTHIVDGEVVFTYEDPRPLSSGRQPYVALYTHAGGWFDRVRIYTRPGADPRPLAGAIADLRIYNRLLGGKEIARLGASGGAVSSSSAT